MQPIASSVRDAVAALNPIPEWVRVLLGSRWFWLALLLAICVSLSRSLLGASLAFVGALVGAFLWWTAVPGGENEIVVLGAVAALGLLGLGFVRSGWAAPLRGEKRCPECDELVRAKAKVCKHCAHRFDAQK